MDAGYDIGVLYRRGLGVPRDFARAARQWRNAAERGSGVAQNALGSAYLYGEGLEYDPIKAYAWFRVAAESGLTVASSNAELAMTRLSEAERESAYAQVETLKEMLTPAVN